MQEEIKPLSFRLGALEGGAKQIFDEIKKDIGTYKYLQKYGDIFEKSMDIDRIIKAIVDIANDERSV